MGQKSAKVNVTAHPIQIQPASFDPMQPPSMPILTKDAVTPNPKQPKQPKKMKKHPTKTLLTVKDPEYLRGLAIGLTWSAKIENKGNGHGLTLVGKNSKQPPVHFNFYGEGAVALWGNDVSVQTLLKRKNVTKLRNIRLGR